MDTNMSTISAPESAIIEAEKIKLQEQYASMDREIRKAHALSLGIKLGDTDEVLTDRLVRHELRRRFGHEAATWNADTDEEGIQIENGASSSPLENVQITSKSTGALRKSPT